MNAKAVGVVVACAVAVVLSIGVGWPAMDQYNKLNSSDYSQRP